MRIEIEGKEVELEGIESDSLVIARPTKQLTPEQMKEFGAAIHRVAREFGTRYGLSFVTANFDSVNFQVLKVSDAKR